MNAPLANSHLSDPARFAQSIVTRGELMRGAHAISGEIGHMNLDPVDGARCICGSRGCFEAMVSMIAAARQFEAQMKMVQTAEKDEQRAQQLLSSR